MKKVCVLVFSVFIFINVVPAQTELSYGLKAGINSTSNNDLNIFGGFAGLDDTFKSKDGFGYVLGAYSKLKLSKFYLSSEITFNNTTSRYDGNPDLKISSLEIPILFGYTLINKFSLYAGPSAQFILDHKFSDSFSLDFDNTAILLFNVGMNLEIARFGFDLRYTNGFSENLGIYLDEVIVDGLGYSIDTKLSSFIFSIAYKLN